MILDRQTVSPRRLLAAGGVTVALAAGVLAAAGGASAPPAPAQDPGPAAAAARPTTAAAAAGEPAAGEPDADRALAAADDGAVTEGTDPEGGSDEPVEDQRAAAYQAAADFAGAYAEHHFDDGPSATLDRVRAFVTDALAAELDGGSGAVAAREERTARQERATATVQAVQEQAGTPEEGRLDLLVVVRQDVTWRDGSEVRWPTYLVQVVRADGQWRVARLLP